MPIRRPRSEDDVCDILFDIFETKTAKPLKDASGQIVGKDCGGDAVAFIDRVPQEFIDHALRWETPLEEYEAFVERIIAEMYPRTSAKRSQPGTLLRWERSLRPGRRQAQPQLQSRSGSPGMPRQRLPRQRGAVPKPALRTCWEACPAS